MLLVKEQDQVHSHPIFSFPFKNHKLGFSKQKTNDIAGFPKHRNEENLKNRNAKKKNCHYDYHFKSLKK